MATQRMHPVIASGLLATAVVALAGCVPSPPVVIEEAIVQQSQAIEDFDDTRYVVDDPEMLDDLGDALGGVAGRDVEIGEGCGGSRTTTVEVTRSSAGAFTVVANTCDDDPTASRLDELVSEWRVEGVLDPAP